MRGFWAAWGGWVLDGMDSFIYSLVLVPALQELLPKSGIPATPGNVGYYGGLLFAHVHRGLGRGAGVGSGCRPLRSRATLMFTILFFSVFTLLAALSTGVWMLGFFAFLRAWGLAANGRPARHSFPKNGPKSGAPWARR